MQNLSGNGQVLLYLGNATYSGSLELRKRLSFLKFTSKDMVPVVFLSFANERRGPSGRFLRNLKVERESIRKALFFAERSGRCKVELEPDITPERLFTTLQDERYRDKISIFHYAGHADDDELSFENAEGGNESFFSSGLVGILRLQENLKLVFLNGCATGEQAKLLIEAGIPAVIATARSIDDGDATLFSKTFYQGLAGGASIERAFKEAESSLLAKHGPSGVSRGIFWEDEPAPEDGQLPWKLFVKDKDEDWPASKWQLFYSLENETDPEEQPITVESLIGYKLNNYRITQYIAQGSYGMVFKAVHEDLNTEAAIKVSYRITEGYEHLKRLVMIGNKGLRMLKHPNIAEVYDVGEASIYNQKRLFTIMELVKGNRLDKTDLGITLGRKEDIRNALDIFLKICEGVRTAHETEYDDMLGFKIRGVVHGNIKSRKILFSEKGDPKLIDFLFADLRRRNDIRMDTPEGVAEKADEERLEDYFPPEQINEGITNVQTDVFSLGAVLFEMFSGKKRGDFSFTDYEEVHKLLRERNRHTPQYVSKMIFFASHQNPAQRFKEVREIIQIIVGNTSFLKRITYWFRSRFNRN
jgi:hypothetical protein